MTVASIYENGGIIGQTLDLGSTERYITGSSVGTPSFVGGASQNNSSQITFSITGLQEGDMLILFATNDFSGSRSITSSGWTEEVNAFSNSVRNIVAHKVMGATVDTNVSFNSGMDSILLCAFRDVDFESISSVVTSNSNTANPPSVSTVDDNSIVLALTGLDDDNATISTGPTGYTEGAAQNANGGSAALYYKTGVATGSEDPSAFTWSSSDANIAYTAVLTRKSVTTFGNFKNSGVWSLDAVYDNALNSVTVTNGTAVSALNNPASISVPYPSNIEAGDLLIVIGSHNDQDSTTQAPTGWTADQASEFEYLFSKTATGTESGSLTITLNSGGTSEAVGQMYLVKTPLTHTFQSFSGEYLSGGTIDITAPSAQGKIDLYLHHAWERFTRTETTAVSNMTKTGTLTTSLHAQFYFATDIGGENIYNVYSGSIQRRLAHYSFS